ncbi:MAG: flagellar basal body L-ring protein FlgH [Pseudobdellovibrionaceae bacterium]
MLKNVLSAKKLVFYVLGMIVVCFLSTACATFDRNTVADVVPFVEPSPLKYSEATQAPSASERQYKKMSKSQMEEDSDLSQEAGSMWMSEGQTSYLFAQNKSRKEGDHLNVKLEGVAQKQVETKVSTIKKLLKRLEEQLKAQQQGAAAEGADRGPASEKKPEVAKAPDEEKIDLSEVQTIPAKITERLSDGTFRIKGSQPMLINDKEFRVIVTGILKPEDFQDEGVPSGRLLESQFDVVSIRRNNQSGIE